MRYDTFLVSEIYPFSLEKVNGRSSSDELTRVARREFSEWVRSGFASCG